MIKQNQTLSSGNAFKRPQVRVQRDNPRDSYPSYTPSKKYESMHIIKNNNFTQNRKPKKQEFKETENDFPSLGGPTTTQNTIDFSNIGKKKEKKKEEKKKENEVESGWVVIRREKGKIVYKYGDKFPQPESIQEDENERIQRAIDKIIARYEYYEELDYEMNGPKYVNSWELNDPTEEYDSSDYDSDDDISSDEEYVINEWQYEEY
jgi:hypothetical protein